MISTSESAAASEVIGWTFLSNHAHVLVLIAKNPEVRLRDIASEVQITERTTQRIINQLRDASVLCMEKIGRRNRYTINLDSELRHPMEASATVGDLLSNILDKNQLGKIRRAYNARRKG
jgi:hypothetical protein